MVLLNVNDIVGTAELECHGTLAGPNNRPQIPRTGDIIDLDLSDHFGVASLRTYVVRSVRFLYDPADTTRCTLERLDAPP